MNWTAFEDFYGMLVKDCRLRYGGNKSLHIIHTATVEMGLSLESKKCIKWTFEGDGDEIFVVEREVISKQDAANDQGDGSSLIVKRRRPEA